MTLHTLPATARRFLTIDDTLAAMTNDIFTHAAAEEGVRAALACHLAAPHTHAAALAGAGGTGIAAVQQAYRIARTSPHVRRLTTSQYYPHRLRWGFAAATLAEWRRRPGIPHAILAGEPTLAETMEIHPTRGTCNYRCRMCLWSDQTELTYTTRGLDTGGIMTGRDWLRVLDELTAAGVRRLVVSGGGEALINPDLPAILHHAVDLGLEISVYTTGYNARPDSTLFAALLRCHRIRFSIHSPDPVTYDNIAGTQPGQRALERVAANLTALRQAREEQLTIGIGMVIQPGNHTQIEAMVDHAESLGADWLDLRKDEVEVTDGLDSVQQESVRAQLRSIRIRPNGATRVDLGDELVALANGMTPDRARTSACLARWFRPTIGAFGHLTPCDLKAEPRFTATGYDLGNVKQSRVLDLVSTTSTRHIADDCAQCMPSSRTGNAILHKLLTDLRIGIELDEQPFG